MNEQTNVFGEEKLHDDSEFPTGADIRPDEPSRRRFMELLGASMALAGITGCVKDPVEKILPYTFRPVNVTPGVSRYYATSMTLQGYGTGVLVESREGRPIKIEGNPAHPASLGATGVFEQASILDLYDPYRARFVLHDRQVHTWEELALLLAAPRKDGGARLRIVLEPTASPLIGALLARIVERHPAVRISFYTPITNDASLDAAARMYGRRLQPHYDLSQASTIVSLGADFMTSTPMHLRHARDFAARRRPAWPNPTMNRLYVAETAPSSTGSLADHRIRRRPSEMGPFAAALAAEILFGADDPGAMATAETLAAIRSFLGRDERAVIIPMARDLRRAGKTALIIAGDDQPVSVHAFAALMNSSLGNAGVTTSTMQPVLVDLGSSQQSFASLIGEMQNGAVDTLVTLEANPGYSAPGDLSFADAVRRVAFRVHLGTHDDETAALANWFVPALHYLESWGDARAYDGTASIVQPLVEPLFNGHAPAEVLAALGGDVRPKVHDILRESWRLRFGGRNFDEFWQNALRRGVITGTESQKVEATLVAGAGRAAIEALGVHEAERAGTYEIAFGLDTRVFDGRFATNPWLQELPDPTTKLTWGNAARMSSSTARALGIENGDLVELSEAPDNPPVASIGAPGRNIVLPALIVPGHAEGAISVALGYGRRAGGPIAEGVGIDVAPLRMHERDFRRGIIARRKDGHVDLALTQTHWQLHGKPIALATTLDEYKKNPEFTERQRRRVLSLLPATQNKGEQWAMTIDTAICSGCSACVVACQAENNIPVVGREEVLRGREMHWLRIDSYHVADIEMGPVVQQPMLCQHCEKAPCEYVCPVNATVHSPDGLNEMVYNRCIGTRFCSNNCPYKVRRFNFFDWSEERSQLNGDVRRLQRNPEVTVRERGVMEKCTFCVQRIRHAEIEASIEARSLRAGEVIPACAAACPTRAIQFDSLRQLETPMVVWRNEPRQYSVLNELGTMPRVAYLAKISNPNSEMG
ncbi:MAG TPA: 4Fe-4S dicluster domain-containing protein [Polyangium sp.]|nr:4Fe-4S dicluster domain-containing protein [Polyangium sp.]